jgi:hypothetical protein
MERGGIVLKQEGGELAPEKHDGLTENLSMYIDKN